MTVKQLVDSLQLEPHPEGGYFRETYRSANSTSVDWSYDKRNLMTSIYFLITEERFSAFHKIEQDEMWYYQGGDGLYIHEINTKGEYHLHYLHLDPQMGKPQVLIPGGSWFASEVQRDGAWCLAGCAVAPGFDFSDFRMADKAEMLKEFPQHQEVIERLCR
jgi:hypothetical protein